MNKTALILALLATGLGLNGQGTPSSYSVTVDFPYASKYVFRGVELAKDSFQPSIELTTGSFYAGLWTNQPIKNNTDNEIDIYAGYGVPLNDTWKLDLGATFYYYPELDLSSGLDEHTFEGYAGITGTVAGFTPGIYAYYDFDLKAFTVQASIGYSIPLETAGSSLDFTVTLGNISPDVGDDFMYYGVGVNLPYKLSEKATVAIGAQYASNDLDGVDGDHLWFTAGVTVGF